MIRNSRNLWATTYIAVLLRNHQCYNYNELFHGTHIGDRNELGASASILDIDQKGSTHRDRATSPRVRVAECIAKTLHLVRVKPDIVFDNHTDLLAHNPNF